MAGISSRALNFGSPETQKIKFNSKELNEDLGLDWYEYGFRNNFDPQSGRFHSVDPLSSDYPYFTPYQFAGNQVPNAIDVDGLEPAFVNDVIGWLITESVKKPDGAATVTLGIMAGVGKFVEKTVTGAINFVTNPPDLTLQGIANNSLQIGFEVADRVEKIQNGSTFEKVVAITETVLDAASVAAGTKVIGTALKGDVIVGTATKTEVSATKGLGNPFKNATLKEVRNSFEKRVSQGTMEKKGPNAYVNKKSGYSYNLDKGGNYGSGGKKVEKPHIDVNYPNPKPKNVPPKKKLEVSGE